MKKTLRVIFLCQKRFVDFPYLCTKEALALIEHYQRIYKPS